MALAKKSKEIRGALSLWNNEEKTHNDVCDEEPIRGFNALESSWEKKGDWRYEQYQVIRGKEIEKELVWIGTIDLKKISESSNSAPIFFQENGKARNDYALARFEDGPFRSHSSIQEYEFNISNILEVLIEAKKNGFSFFHILLKESVNGRGRHFISLLHKENAADEHYCGIPSQIGIAEMDYYVMREYDHIDFNEYEEMVILFNDEYRWLK